MMTITTNTRGASQMRPSYQDLSGPELVAAYNAMAAMPAVSGIVTVRPVTKFRDHATGVKRCSQMAALVADNGGVVPQVRPATTAAAAAVPSPDVADKKPARKPDPETTPQRPRGIAEEFDFRVGSSREKLLLTLNDSFGRQVPLATLAKDVLGTASAANQKAIETTMRGLPWRINESRLKYRIKREKKDGKVTYGIHAQK